MKHPNIFGAEPPQLGRILTASRLQLYGYAVAVTYACFMASCYGHGTWVVDRHGAPIYTDFACAWTAAIQALRGAAGSLYDPASFIEAQSAVVGTREALYPNWPYPPTFLLVMAPFASLRYAGAFFAWDISTLLGLLIIVYIITGRAVAIALVLACPFTAWNFLAAQNGFLTASLIGAALISLERRPILAGVFIGILTYKPQFGVLFPVALVAARQWRPTASAAVTAVVLAGASAAAFGTESWRAFPHELLAQSELNFGGDWESNWGYLQSVYGLMRLMRSGASLAWLAQAATTAASAIAIWLIWRSKARYSLKAAALAVAALIATPYAFAYDMAALAIPAAFLVKDQIQHGSLKIEAMLLCALFGTSLGLLLWLRDTPGSITFGGTPTGILVALALAGITAQRVGRSLRRSQFCPGQ